MDVINDFLEGVIFETIPKAILNEFKKFEFTTIYKCIDKDNQIKFSEIPNDFESPFLFLCKKKYFQNFSEYLKSGVFKMYNAKELISLFDNYSKGFSYGYKNYEDSIKKQTSLFNPSNEHLTKIIFNRVHELNENDGRFIPESFYLDMEYRKINNLNNQEYFLDSHEFYKLGVNGGEFFKAWDIILKNAVIFEDIFSHHNTIKNTSNIENINLGMPSNDIAISFFYFLINNYKPNENSKVKFVNILHYLKNDADKKHFIFNLKQEDFNDLLISTNGIKIKKFQKSERYEEVEKPILRSLESAFLRSQPS
jgi:hypothetical protein